MFRFEQLAVWEKAIGFADKVYEITRTFPSEERFGLTSQMRRAAVSISSNIAEGSGRLSDKDFAHFIQIAYSSLMETISEAHVARRQSMLQPADSEQLIADAEELARMLSGLRTSLQRNPS